MENEESVPEEANNETTKLIRPINDDKNEEEKQNDDEKSLFSNKYLALFFMCSSVFGQNFIIDNPAALQDYLEDALKITNSQFSSLYAYYFWSNVV